MSAAPPSLGRRITGWWAAVALVLGLLAIAAATRGSDPWVVSLLAAAGVVIAVAGVALSVALHRLLVRPVNELAEQVRHIAAGDYDRTIVASGPPEVAALAADVDRMRQKIAADLAEVRGTRLAIEEANRQLERQAEELTRSNRDLEQFAYVASHDLQEPLRKVASFCQLLQRRYAGQLDERADQYIAFAVDGAQRMQRLINDLLAFSRIGRVTNGFADVDLNQVARDTAEQLDQLLEYTAGELTWDELPTVHGEQALLDLLFANLVGNSLKFRRPDTPPRVHLSACRSGDEWQITCADNGIGIEPEFADKVFIIFQRLHGRGDYPGTGIGLAIAKKIVEYHGGRIWLDTGQPDGGRPDGARIAFTLPAPVRELAGSTAGEGPGTDAGADTAADGTATVADGTDGAADGTDGAADGTDAVEAGPDGTTAAADVDGTQTGPDGATTGTQTGPDGATTGTQTGPDSATTGMDGTDGATGAASGDTALDGRYPAAAGHEPGPAAPGGPAVAESTKETAR